MALMVFNRINGSAGSRLQVTGINLQGNVQEMRDVISKQINISGEQIGLLNLILSLTFIESNPFVCRYDKPK